MNKLNRLISVLLAASTVILSSPGLAGGVSAADSEGGEQGGIRYIKLINDDNGYTTHFEDEDGNVVEFERASKDIARAESYPTSYSSVDNDFVTAVKNQNPYGTCWAFATVCCLETFLLKNGIKTDASELDFSENHLAYFAKYTATTDTADRTYGDGETPDEYDDAYNEGGYWYEPVAALARGSGPIDDSLSVYKTVPDESLRYSREYSLDDYVYIKRPSQDEVKKYVLETGAVYGLFYSIQSSYYQGTFYDKSNGGSSINHAVTIVGWDDDFSATNFKYGNQPDGDGAWLVKNSWGTSPSYMNEGYFWLSYYEKSFNYIGVYTLTDRVDNVYQYEVDGPSVGLYNGGKTVRGANIFTADDDEYLSSVGFYDFNEGSDYRVRIFSLAKASDAPDSGTLLAEVSGTADFQGYHTVELTTPVKVNKGTVFSAEVTVYANETKTNYPVLYAESNSNYCTPNVSYFSEGASAAWTALDGTDCGNIGIKVNSVKASSSTDVAIDAAKFPDSTFRSYVADSFDTDKNGKLSTSEIAAATEISVANKGISSLKGIEFFTALTSLNCSGNKLTSLDLSKNTALSTVSLSGQTATVGESDFVKSGKKYEITIDGHKESLDKIPESFSYTLKIGYGSGKTADMDITVTVTKSRIPGDVDGNGTVNGIDDILLQRYLADWDVTIDLSAADVDGSGNVNGIDDILLQRYLADWDVVLK